MQVFDKGKIYDFMKFRYFTFALSAVLIIGSIALFFIKGINYGIDFSGGTLIQVKYDAKAPLDEIRKRFEAANLGNINVTEFGSDQEVTIRYSVVKTLTPLFFRATRMSASNFLQILVCIKVLGTLIWIWPSLLEIKEVFESLKNVK